ncbi:glycosyl hydrolase [Sordaria brevicollis]|uniref:Glycosyl hydrolase n=1 Tax=Sordaria brevicollis TaxID=83679 RepID=A0AAE0U2U6_SORBR|nr:glycosyl hydrolase [Sordaria brevicollis]
MHHHLLSVISLFGIAASPALAALQIVPGGTWTASNGDHLNAHGAGVIIVNSTFYLIGEDKSQGSVFTGVNCYSSTDLVQWKYEGALLSRTGSSGDLGPNRIIERPKVIYNDATRKYVMWMHVDSSNYGDAKVGVATSDTVCGKYSYNGSFRPLGFESRDMGLFKDDDGKAYLLTEDRKNGLRINLLSPDYLSLSPSSPGSVHLFPQQIESPALLKVSGRYYMFGSHLTGWDPNDNVFSTSLSLSGPWSDWAIFADKGSNTYFSQTTYVLDYGGGNVMYMGDRWRSKNLRTSSYVWLPMEISGTKVVLKNRGSWVPNVGTGGKWAVAPGENGYEGEKGTYGGGAKEVSWSVTISGVQSNNPEGGVTTVMIRYMNGDSGPRYAGVSVNGGSPQKVAFEGTAGEVGVSSVVVKGLRQGSGNTIVVSGWEGAGWGPDVDRVVVPVQ